MKKQFSFLCLSVLAVFVFIICGVFIGRNFLYNDHFISPEDESPVVAEGVLVDGKININRANADQLQLIPGVGQTLAEQIVSYRQENGPFGTVADLTLVPGVGEKTFRDLFAYITVSED